LLLQSAHSLFSGNFMRASSTFLCLSFCSLVTDALSLLDTIVGLAGA
jgi:hypothetical protein